MSASEDYARVAELLYHQIFGVLLDRPDLGHMNPVELWRSWPDGAPKRERGVTWLQWSAAHELALESMGLPPRPYGTGDLAFVFPMDDEVALRTFLEMTG